MNLDSAKMKALMKQMGMSQENIDASKVTIEKNDGTNIVIENPSVIKLNVQGQESFQITGDVKEIQEEFSESDVKIIMEKTGASRKKAEETLKKTGDLADAILELS